MFDILSITGPIYLCIAAGYASVRWGLFTAAEMRVFGRFVIQIALPALLFNALASRPLAEVVNPAYLIAYSLGSLVVVLAGVVWARKARGKGLTEAAYEAMGMACANSGYVGFPVMLLTFGPLAGVVLALNLIVENLIVIPLLLAMADAGAHVGERPSLVKASAQMVQRLVRNPLIVAIVLGFAVAMTGWTLPSVLLRTVNLFSSASGGLALFIIGGSLVGLEIRGLRRQVGTVAFGKLVLHPLAVWAVVALMPLIGLPVLQGDLRTAAVLSAAMPMLGIYSLLASRHGFEGFTAAALLMTTGLSFVSLSALLWLMHHATGWLN